MNGDGSRDIGSASGGWLAFGGLLLAATLLVGLSGPCSRRPDIANQKKALVPTQQATGNQPGIAVAASKSGSELYAQHCAACHGERGDGKGIAATYLFPKPRDFLAGKFRLVSTTNRVPSADDLDAVLVRGMPGSSMPPWAHLSDHERGLLIEEVQRLARDGARQQYVDALQAEEGLTDEEVQEAGLQQEIATFVEQRVTPGPATEVPVITPATDESVARGKAIYIQQGCHSCHGDDGRGDGQQAMMDDEGFPTRPRDFTLGIFKGGHDPASLYRRTAFGMPGTPMPSSRQLAPDQIVDLVHFIRSLSTEEARQQAILRRERIVAKRVPAIPTEIDSAGWNDVDAVELRTTPLWWRDDANTDLQVQAVHDGQVFAFRLSWKDDTPDKDAARSESFEDAVAVELHQGNAEPFIGMGDSQSPVDVWYWDADRQGKPLAVEDLYPNTVVDVFPFSEQVAVTAESNRPGAMTADQPEISLPARAAGNPIVPTADESGASSLSVGGLGSLTFRLPTSSLVEARGEWQNGRWTVIMTRRLAVDSAVGVSLSPGSRASVALAVWDGSAGDRDGRKLVTIWQELVLEGSGGEPPTLPDFVAAQPIRPSAVVRPAPSVPRTTPRVEPTPIMDGEWGNLSGRFVFDGPAPEPEPVSMTKDQAFCGRHNLVNESLNVNPDNSGLANVVVYLYIQRGKDAPLVHPSYADSAAAAVRFDNDQCRFDPHVCLLRTGQTLLIGNKDTVGHNTKIDTTYNSPINPITPAGSTLEHRFATVERVPASVSCSIHSWMSAWVLVCDHPYFAKTDEDGRFEIPNLPVGEWTFQVWHERASSISQVVRNDKTESWSRGRLTSRIEPGNNDLGEVRVSPQLFE